MVKLIIILALLCCSAGAVDKVKPLKIENPASGGTQTDVYPTDANPAEDYITGKGFSFENSDTPLLDLSGTEIAWKDSVQTTKKKINDIALNLTLGIYFGDCSDGNLTSSSGTTTLTRNMYYNNITLSGTAVLNPAGYKIYVCGTLALSGTSSITRTPNIGTNASGQTNGNGGAILSGVDMGDGLAGQAGSQGASGGLGGSGGVAGNNAGTTFGYGGAGAASGSAGSGAAGTAGTYQHIPERIIRHDHINALAYKNGGQGGAGGAGGSASVLGNGGGGGGGGSGGGVILIFARTFNSTSSTGIVARGGAGGNGGAAPNGNSTGGGGGGGGGGGQVYIICYTLTAVGTITVTGGAGGTGGAGSGSGSAGNSGSTGSTGHYEVYNFFNNAWTVL